MSFEIAGQAVDREWALARRPRHHQVEIDIESPQIDLTRHREERQDHAPTVADNEPADMIRDRVGLSDCGFGQ